jgi:hypothetical protein
MSSTEQRVGEERHESSLRSPTPIHDNSDQPSFAAPVPDIWIILRDGQMGHSREQKGESVQMTGRVIDRDGQHPGGCAGGDRAGRSEQPDCLLCPYGFNDYVQLTLPGKKLQTAGV